jgi:hypothetical protein
MRHGLQGHEPVAPPLLVLIEAFNAWVKATRKMRGFNERPTEIMIAVFGVPLAVNFAITEPLTLHAATIGGQVSHARKARYCPCLQQDRQRENIPDPGHRFESVQLGLGALVAQHHPL